MIPDFLKRFIFFPDVVLILFLTTGIFTDQNDILVNEQIIKFNVSISDFKCFPIAGEMEKSQQL